MKTVNVQIGEGSRAAFVNNAAYCVGTGRMGLALQREYQDQLRQVQALCHFQHIRGHGLFCEDMSIYQPYLDEEGILHDAYCFTYLDRVMDDYRAAGLKPFLELGFMPSAMASGTQTIFYWRGNVTPPAQDERWTALVRATLRHLAERYGEDEVASWPCEVWNEPNLAGFWENADEEKYLHLYEITAKAVKEAVPGMCVGGPAVCGGATTLDWIRHFLTFCRDKRLPLDFVTRHAYLGNAPETKGRYLYHTMRDVDDVMEEMRATREVIDSYPEYAGMEMHLTEFNTSYNPFCPIHDTNLNAAYIAGLLARLGDVAASYSYWTFGDVFEESGVPSRPFHGGFGMMANQRIPKPTLWTFAFFNDLKGEPVYRDEHCVLTRRADGGYEGVAWNLCRDSREEVTLNVAVPAQGRMALLCSVVDEHCCNPLKRWHDMGEPATLTETQLAFLRTAGVPATSSETVDAQAVEARFTLTLRENAVVRFTLTKASGEPDYGYDYTWYRDHA